MRKQIAAANWKMNGNITQATTLLHDVFKGDLELAMHQEAIFAVPFPFLMMAERAVVNRGGYFIAAQNCSSKSSGAYTGETSVEMLKSIDIKHCIVGHSERREYFNESNIVLADKVNLCLHADIIPIFCCGEPLNIREANTQDHYVEMQIRESLFHLSADQVQKVVIAYEPIWAIGTGKTASTAQAQEMHEYIRGVIQKQYGVSVANVISILYGGSVKANNAAELFASKDVDGGLVGGASLIAADFIQIIKALKN
ncbi:MAG: triose-phosphate isomerase [Flavitalea sp.]